MAEVAGLVLGGIPLVILALEKYAEPFSAYHRYRVSIEDFRSDLIIQKRQLHTTISSIGLSSDSTMEELRECLERQYPDVAEELMSIFRRMNGLTAELLKDLDVDVKGRPTLLPGKLKWEWRRVKHSVNIKKREKFVGDLRHWNQDLKGCLERSEVPAEDESQKVQDLKRRFNPKRCDALRELLSSLHGALGSVFTCDCAGPAHEAAIDLDWNTYELATNPIKVSVFSKAGSALSTDAGECHVWRRLHAVPEATPATTEVRQTAQQPQTLQVTAGLPSCSKSPRKARGVQFAIFRTLSKTSSDASSVATMTTTRTTTMTTALEELTLIPGPADQLTDICAAVCLGHATSTKHGLIKDPDQGNHFSIWNSQDRHRITEKIPIKSLLSRTGVPPHQRRWPMLSAKQRYGLAVAIAWSVLHLGDSPWLKDLWDREQMGVFVESRNHQEVLCRYPCTSHVFGPTGAISTEPTLGDKLYNHISQKNVFLLGVLLIELCINESITGSGSILDVNEVARSKLEEVCCTAGSSYGYAAERCIKFAFEGRESYRQFSFSTFRQQFHDVVLAPVKATYLMFPDAYGSM